MRANERRRAEADLPGVVAPKLDTGARRLSPVEQRAESGETTTYLVGDFVFATPGTPGSRAGLPRLRVGEHGLTLSPALVVQLPEPPRRVRIGVDVQRRLLTLVPVPGRECKLSYAVSCKHKPGKPNPAWTVGNVNMCAWLLTQGVPAGVDIPARWQPQTGSIVGRWPQ